MKSDPLGCSLKTVTYFKKEKETDNRRNTRTIKGSVWNSRTTKKKTGHRGEGAGSDGTTPSAQKNHVGRAGLKEGKGRTRREQPGYKMASSEGPGVDVRFGGYVSDPVQTKKTLLKKKGKSGVKEALSKRFSFCPGGGLEKEKLLRSLLEDAVTSPGETTAPEFGERKGGNGKEGGEPGPAA